MDDTEPRRSQRLDQYVAQQLPELSRASAAKVVAQGLVSVNGQVGLKSGYKLHDSDVIKISYDHPAASQIPDIELPVLYEDSSCVVINKPVGVLSHSKGAFNPEATVATWLAKRVKGMSGERAGIVHRLDRATSGVMICAKTPSALSWLQKQFSLRKVKKTYIAVVSGVLKQEHAIIDIPIERNPKKPQTFRPGSNGKHATTEYKVLKTNSALTLVKLMPTTGRTHQLRVHLKHLGHPILGDTLYDGAPADRLYLHASSLEITLTNRERKVFESPVPPEFQAALKP